MSKRYQTWVLLDHMCANCGGRMLCGASGFGPTGGGNPVFACADCGNGSADMGPERFCWCGFGLKGHEDQSGAYMCLPLSAAKEHPKLRQEFMSCGSNPDSKRATIGVVTRVGYKKAMEG